MAEQPAPLAAFDEHSEEPVAKPELAAADSVTLSNDEDGVAEAIRRFVI